MLNSRLEENRKSQFKRSCCFSFYPGLNLVQVHGSKIHGIENIAGKRQNGAMRWFSISIVLGESDHFKAPYRFSGHEVRIGPMPASRYSCSMKIDQEFKPGSII